MESGTAGKKAGHLSLGCVTRLSCGAEKKKYDQRKFPGRKKDVKLHVTGKGSKRRKPASVKCHTRRLRKKKKKKKKKRKQKKKEKNPFKTSLTITPPKERRGWKEGN